MAGSRGGGDDRVLRRLRYAAAIVAISAFGFIVAAYVVAYATREAASAPDGPLVVILVTAVLILLGLVSPSVLTNLIGSRGGPPRKDDEP